MKHTIKYILALNAFVFVALIMLTLPMNIYADPPVKCPCFTLSKIERNFARTITPIGCDEWSFGGDFGTAVFNEENDDDHFAFAFVTGYEDDYYYCETFRYNTRNDHWNDRIVQNLTEEQYLVCYDILSQWCP